MKKTLVLILFFIISLNSFSENIGISKADKVAVNWMNERTGSSFTKNSISNHRYIIEGSDTLFYLIEFSPKGFIIISSDDIAVPVLMYSSEKYSEEIPPGFEEMLSSRKSELLYAKKSGVKSSSEIKKLWENYSCEPIVFHKKTIIEKVDPLITAKWNQSYPYNKFCPACDSAGSGGRTYAGCVALAFAQVVKYHNWPTCGNGSYEYVYQPYGKISANFGATYYDWSNMTNTITSASPVVNIDAVATLIFHCGVAVNMLYGPGGSGAETPDIRNGLVKYFKYSDEAVVISKKKKIDTIPYTDQEWSGILKNELLNSRPFVYRGNNVNGYQGHAFVIHGFNGDYFDVNFGWGGSYNGSYYLNSLTPAKYNFSYSNQAIINIKPKKFFSNISLPDKTIKQPLSFTLNWDYVGDKKISRSHVQLSLNSDMKNIVKDIYSSTNSIQINDLMAGNKYYWQLTSFAETGETETSEIFSFTTKYPTSAALYQNYPNPFNPETTIKFNVIDKGFAKLKIFSITGEEVAALVDRFLEAKEYRIIWNAKNIPSGVYFCYLEMPFYSAAKKLILVK